MGRIFLLICFLLSGCAYRHPLSDFRFQTEPAGSHVVASWSRITAPGQPVKIYIDADAPVSDGQRESDAAPLPDDAFWRGVAGADPSPNVVYLARPCQLVRTGNCTARDWTTGRYAPAIVDSMDAAVRQAMKRARTERVILLGYRGGAHIAGLIAARRPEQAVRWISVAGLPERAAGADWVRLPQAHYVGERDAAAAAALKRAAVNEKAIVVVPRASDVSGLDKIVPALHRER
ncbi:MAG: hypothetical protein PHX68_01685 [Alphaproteobacteria bacterium]|nr:hypothetical protein [Alphaproteobacteria bacterium]